MQFLALSRRLEGTTPEMLASLSTDESRVAWQLHVEGVIRSVHMCPERQGSMIVLECATLEEAQAALAQLPMVAERMITFDVSRMLPFTGWSALFSKAGSL